MFIRHAKKLCLFVLLQGFAFNLSLFAEDFGSQVSSSGCDPGIDLSSSERTVLLERISGTEIGKKIIKDYIKKYDSLSTMVIQWDLVSYSQIISPSNINEKKSRSLASVESKTVCIHLTKKLPEIEHLADLLHEMDHAVYLNPKNSLKHRDIASVNTSINEKAIENFIHSRIAGIGGEAEAFGVECVLKKELLSEWDHLCGPYSKNDTEMDIQKIIDALYSGTLSASLTGQTYPVMLRKQYLNMLNREKFKRIDSTLNSAVN